MPKLYITYGCPRSGKTTWAKKLRDENRENVVRVNKDDLRAMLHSPGHNNGQEKLTVSIRDKIVEKSLRDGKDVVVDDTNFPFGGTHYKRLCEIAQLVGDVTVIEKFFDASLPELLRRNKESLDGKPVPEDVIYNMFNKHVKGKQYVFDTVYFQPVEKIKYNPDLPDCVIFDVDGTLAHMQGRSAYDWKRVGEDIADFNVRRIYDYLKVSQFDGQGPDELIIFSGRDGSCLEETAQWLTDNKIFYDKIFLRPEGNMEKDSIIKKRMYDEHIKGKYNVVAVFDDRQQVVDMYRAMGITVCQVANGDF